MTLYALPIAAATFVFAIALGLVVLPLAALFSPLLFVAWLCGTFKIEWTETKSPTMGKNNYAQVHQRESVRLACRDD